MRSTAPAPVTPGIPDPAALRRALGPSQVCRPLARLPGLEASDIAVAAECTHFSATRPATLH